jgi:hypothetical protein
MQFNMSKAFIKQKAIFETTIDLNVMNVQDIYIGLKKIKALQQCSYSIYTV